MPYSSELEKLEKRFNENPRGRNFAPLADAYRKAGEVDKAIELCVSGLERHPDYVSAHIVHGRCLIDLKNDVGAEEVFKKVLSLDPENIIALKVLAEIAERGSRHEEAVEWLSRLLAADPMNGDAEEHLKQARSKAAAAKAAAAAAPPEPVVEPVAEAVPESRPLLDLDAIAATETPTAAMSQPSFPEDAPLVQHDEVILQAGTRSADIETFDGDLGFTTASPAADGLVVEDSEPLKPDGLNIEGLARTQYEGSGMFRLDAPEGPPPPVDTVRDLSDSGPAADLPLIMPDDIEPNRRSSIGRRTPVEPEPRQRASRTSGATPVPAAVSLSDDEGAADAATLQAAEPVVTETMGDLYLQQGHREDARRVYRALLAERPGDARLAAKLRAVESPTPPPPPPLRPHQPPAESATAFLRRVWRGEPAAPFAAPRELTGALEAAFALAPRQSDSLPQASADRGQPTQPAEDVISLDAVFGDQVGRGAGPELPPPPTPPAEEAPAAGRGGFSFDDFFGAGGSPARPSPRTSRPNRPQPEDEDLDQFQAWLKGLKT